MTNIIRKSVAVLTTMFLLAACGSEAPPPAPVSPTPPQPGNNGGSLGFQIEAPTPGTPLFQVQDPQALQRMAQGLSAQGYATVTQRNTVQYSVQPGNPAVWNPLGSPQQNPVQQTGTYQYYGNAYYGDIQIEITSPLQGRRTFRFVSRYSLHGLILESTDQVALFESQSGPRTLLKIPYQSQNPQILAFTLESIWNGGGIYYGGFQPQQQYGLQYLVTAESFTTSLHYPQQYQQPYQQQQQQNLPNGGFF